MLAGRTTEPEKLHIEEGLFVGGQRISIREQMGQNGEYNKEPFNEDDQLGRLNHKMRLIITLILSGDKKGQLAMSFRPVSPVPRARVQS